MSLQGERDILSVKIFSITHETGTTLFLMHFTSDPLKRILSIEVPLQLPGATPGGSLEDLKICYQVLTCLRADTLEGHLPPSRRRLHLWVCRIYHIK